MTIPFIDLKTQYAKISEGVNARINGILNHGQYILGPEVGELEKVLAEYVGVKHCLGVSSGSDALLIAMLALDIGPGDEVITTPFTFIATAEMISLIGAQPVFVDIAPDTYNIDPVQLEAAITGKTKAIMPVSLYGQCADFNEINRIADKHKLPVIEDGAQSFGATYKDKMSCGLSTIGCTSFFPSKPLGCYGDGGACFTNDDHLADLMRQLHVHGQDRRYHHPRIGINGRIDTLQAGILLEKMKLFPEEVVAREQIGARYTELLSPHVQTPTVKEGNTSVYAQYTIEVDNRDAVADAINKSGVPTAVHYPIPLSLQPAFADLGHRKGDFPISEQVSDRVMSLPMHPYLSEHDQDTIIAAVVKAL